MISFPGTIPIRIFPIFWLLAIAIGWMSSGTILGTAIWTVVIIVSVIVHELGHALTAMAFGQKAEIQLVGLGGLTLRDGPKLKLWQEFAVILNGPVAGLLLCVVSYLIYVRLPESSVTVFGYAVMISMYANLFWTVVNLLPVQPLDGGRLLGIILEAIFGLRGVKISLFISIVLSVVIAVFFLARQNFLAGAIFFMMTFESYRAWKVSLGLTEKDQNLFLQEMLNEAQKDIRVGNYDEAEMKLKHLREITQKGVIYLTATEFLASLLHTQDRDKEAYQLLMPLKSKLSPEMVKLLHQLAYQAGNYQEAISLGSRSYQNYPSYDTALINALCHSTLGEVQPAVGWLECAIRDGIPNPQAVLKKPEFDSIRSNERFQALLHSHM